MKLLRQQSLTAQGLKKTNTQEYKPFKSPSKNMMMVINVYLAAMEVDLSPPDR